MDPTAYSAVAGLQIAIIVAGLLAVGVFTLKSSELTAKFLWNLARTVVIFLPMALAWFSLFSGMFFQDMTLLLPVLVAVMAVGLNFMIDAVLFKGGFAAIRYIFSSMLSSIFGRFYTVPLKGMSV